MTSYAIVASPMAPRSPHRPGLSRRQLVAGGTSLLVAGGCHTTRTGPPVQPVPGPPLDPTEVLTRIAFGSCLDQERPQPIWSAVEAYQPQLLLLLGDNVYANAEDEATLREAYAALGRSEGFRRIRATTPVLATWDDHDYGRDDAGREYPLRDVSQRIMLDFFDEPADSPRRQRPGVYRADTFGPAGQRVQVLLLDTRYFRSELPHAAVRGRYQRSEDPGDTILGDAQWAWLEQQLREPADLRVLISSVQLVADGHDFERWGVFPHERQRLLSTIAAAEARGVIVLSGDRHHAELSVLDDGPVGYPLHDLTSSSLNRPSAHPHEVNEHRRGSMVAQANFGTIDIDWEAGMLVLGIRDEQGVVRLDQRIRLASLSPAPAPG